jgi:RNA polymerase primary sigma factor
MIKHLIPDTEGTSPEEALVQKSTGERIRTLMKMLTPREKIVLERRFGIDGQTEQTLQQLGEEFGLTRERIRQIENRALSKLRNESRMKSLDWDLLN